MYNYLTSAFPLSVCGMLRFAVRFQRNTHFVSCGQFQPVGVVDQAIQDCCFFQAKMDPI